MGLDINLLRKEADGGEYRSEVRLCVTSDGELTTEDDPRAVMLLVGAGCSIPAKEAELYGLIGKAATAPAAPAEPRKRVLSDLTLAELLDLAKDSGVDVPEKAKKAEVFKLLKDAKVDVPQVAQAPQLVTGDGSGDASLDFAAMSPEELEAFAEEHEVDVPDGTDDEALRQLLLEAEKTAG